jgi:hypothetical protein
MVTVFIIAGLLALSALWFFIGVLFAKRNPGYMEAIDDAYIKGRTEAEKEIKEKLKEAEAYIKSKTGSVEIPSVSIGELKKYLLRFGLPLVGLIGLIWLLKPENIGMVFYKITLLVISLILCELVWLMNYKPVFGKIEVLSENERRTVLIFRGVLYLAIVLGITWGL